MAGRLIGAAAELWRRPSAVRRTARRAAPAGLVAEPLPPTQGELLRLAEARPGISVAEAAQELRLAPNTVSTLVGKLADAGLLSRDRARRTGGRSLLTSPARRPAADRPSTGTCGLSWPARALGRLPGPTAALARAVPALIRLAERAGGH